MSTFALSENASGYKLYQINDPSFLDKDLKAIQDLLRTETQVGNLVTLKASHVFENMKIACEETLKLQEGNFGSELKGFLKRALKKEESTASLLVWDKALASAVKKKFKLDTVIGPASHEILRAIKTHMESAGGGAAGVLTDQEMYTSLATTLSRFKMKFSADKVDVMIIQAVGLVDDLDKEVNNLAMRLKEWYGFHFPELLRIIDGNVLFARFVSVVGYREHVRDFSPESLESEVGLSVEVATQVRNAAESSMGSEIVDADLACLKDISGRTLELYEYRDELMDYLRKRMEVVAPNLTCLVGEVLGAKLLAQAGSLTDLAKQPASTVQLLGAEKALFRALKAQSNTPKYGLIFHAKLVGQAPAKVKGKMSRMLGNKIAICVRKDAFGTDTSNEPIVGRGLKGMCEKRLEDLTTQPHSQTAAYRAMATRQATKYTPSRLRETPNERSRNLDASKP